MAVQTFGSPFSPLGSAQYVGADAVIALTTAPTDAGGFGKTLTQIETTLNATPDGGPYKIVKSLMIGVEGGTIHALETGQTPTAAIGIPYAEGVHVWENDPTRIHAAKFYIPTGVTVNFEYGA